MAALQRAESDFVVVGTGAGDSVTGDPDAKGGDFCRLDDDPEIPA